jgi:hypothetical protein
MSKSDVFIGGPIFGPILNWFVRISGLSRLIFWFCFDCKWKLPKWFVTIAPWLFGLAIGRKAAPGSTRVNWRNEQRRALFLHRQDPRRTRGLGQ